MKTTLTRHIIERIAGNVSLTRRCTQWLDVLHDPLVEADNEWAEHGRDEPHPVTQLIDAVYHDLIAAGYWKALDEKDAWEDRARELGFKHDWE